MAQSVNAAPVPPRPVRVEPVRDRVDSIAAPMDRIRWSAVLGGLFTVLATLTVLTILGLAIGLATLDANNPRSFAFGASGFGIISAIIAFGLGGFIAARTAAVAGPGNGLLNGAMVWIVTIALIVNFLTAGIGTFLGIASDAASTAATIAAPVVGQAAEAAAENPALAATAVDGAQAAATNVAPVVQQAQQAVENIDPADVERAADEASKAAWMTLLALGLTAAASIIGGLAGQRSFPTDVAVNNDY